eukprot:jgi/Chlat1/4114/Chrsp26S04138
MESAAAAAAAVGSVGSAGLAWGRGSQEAPCHSGRVSFAAALLPLRCSRVRLGSRRKRRTAALAASAMLMTSCMMSHDDRQLFLGALRTPGAVNRRGRKNTKSVAPYCCSQSGSSSGDLGEARSHDGNAADRVRDEASTPGCEPEITSAPGTAVHPKQRFSWWPTSFMSSKHDSWWRRLCGFKPGEELWSVPWTLGTVTQVMFLWLMAFWMLGSFVIPSVARRVGLVPERLTYRGQAWYHLLTDVVEMAAGLGILYRCLAPFRPFPSGQWFPFKLQGRWFIDVLVACMAFPIVNTLAFINQELLPIPGGGLLMTSPLEESLGAKDPIANLVFVVVVAFCAPAWEEIIFRGFLLPSLTRYIPLGAALAVSAGAFAIAHFSLQRLLPLWFLGMVMGIVFMRTRNLLASMVLHSLWNCYVFWELLNGY